MNFADAFQNFLSRITGQTDRIEAATGKLEAALASHVELSAENTRLKGENESLTNSLAAAPKPEAIESLTTARDEALGRATTAESALETFKAEMPGKITTEANAAAARTVASAGHTPLDVAVDSPAPGAATNQAKTGEGRTRSTWAKPF